MARDTSNNKPPHSDSDLLRLIPGDYAQKHLILPISQDQDGLLLACSAQLPAEVIAELRFMLRKDLQFETWPAEELREAIKAAYQLNDQAMSKNGTGKFIPVDADHRNVGTGLSDKQKSDTGVVAYINQVISEAIASGASDIHVESDDGEFRIRLRIDGKLILHDQPPFRPQAIISRLKILADMDIAEKRRPQDGRIRMESAGKVVDIRVSTLPTDFGEKVVMRILDKSALNLSLDNLGMVEADLINFRKVLKMPYGMVLVTGPTGSGKTTTLYAALNFLNEPCVNITTIEDPIEYNLKGVNQTMIRPDIDLTFASVLRTVLRQDPNIVMVGEIRDGETAEIAIRSALTGHLVLSTLHTNDALSTITRLTDMGIEPFLVANSLRMVIAQRLIRRICPNCKSEDKNALQRFQHYALPKVLHGKTLYKGTGCSDCRGSGYRGREAIFEPLLINERVADLILHNSPSSEIREALKAQGSASLTEAGFRKVIAGITTLEEVISETFIH